MHLFKRFFIVLVSMGLLIPACAPLQQARVQQEVTIDTHFEEQTPVNRRNTVMVLTLAKEEKTLSKTTLTANEVTADILSLELLNRGFKVVDRAVINDYLKEKKTDLSVTRLIDMLEMGRTLHADFLILTNLFENLQASNAITFLPGEVLTSIDTSANIGVSSRMIDLKNGEVIWIGIATTQDQNFQKALQRISKELIASLETQASR
ncbi:MAG: hypothetical protein CO150_07140 [Nitrospirae bacterium CG_4_9_14_3_um_filter_53_35]|nr:MAG: hypothetical protein AUK29_10815 [Nitrospirae bacterium CG2_30_53_67]PIS36587.1 MAG: hypothetical protein COT35_10340 [Nitrospirae bacterium CG08_land_8_20_14_0_20_52_24]PIV82379.1 MAG: hypothetical protein COW52_13920 [Nitrospirae bacterium CG17_big_fil_post_rev_8_21_14_2_50_50_9]PIW85350.1 MAG: hypothetical protein COZ95_04995 [Nitrospirae bacterium CG_4_8_14_3_um_filter_50_41]PIX85675.1 MAG: hypothetical protein COZ32_07280 [Nitrospirae bacterium CG_4_10_14_3_um_filter_53_41]PJA7415